MDEGLRDLLQAVLQGHILHEGNADIAAEGRCAQALLQCLSLFEHRHASSKGVQFHRKR
jgi:hypothetical protein